MLCPDQAKTTRRHRKRRLSGNPPVELGPDIPHWLAADGCWEKLPPEIRQAVPRVVAPAYRHWVLDAPNDLERSMGTTLVHLTWLELCGQMQMARVVANPDSLEFILESPEQMVDRHLRLAKVKCRTVACLARLKVINAALGRSPAARWPTLELGVAPIACQSGRRTGEVASSQNASCGFAAPIGELSGPPTTHSSPSTDHWPLTTGRSFPTTGHSSRPTGYSSPPPNSPAAPTLAGRLKSENRRVDDQLDHAALRLLAAQPELFVRQGCVSATWRRRNGKTFGPYYRLGYRSGGRQCAVYLGRAGTLVERVRETLARLQRPRAERRVFERLERRIRASLRIEKIRLQTLLCPYGLRLKGSEVRGWRNLFRFRTWLPPRRRLMPRMCLRKPSFPVRLANDAVSRMHRFLEARDGHAPACAVDPRLELPHPLRDNGRGRPPTSWPAHFP